MGAAESTQAGAEGSDALPSALVVTGPSGVGKGTLIKKLMEGSDAFGFSTSHTTRKPRDGEQDGVHYWFTTREQMEADIEAGKFLEYADVHGNLYGTSIKAVKEVAAEGKCCILDIDVQGARQVRKVGLRAIFIFIAPPSTEELERRLRGRGTETDEQIQRRLDNAKGEIASMKEKDLYDFIIVNDSLEEALGKLVTLARAALEGKTGASIQLPAEPTDGPQDEPASSSADAGPSEESAPLMSNEAGAQKTAAAAPAPPATATAPDGLARWKGKVALVTGASAGIGWAVCQELAARGVRVVAVARRRERLEQLQQDLVNKGVPIADFLPVVCDITKEAEVVALPRIILKRWPDAGVDILVNNAGLGRNNAALWDGSTSSWVEMISTNVLGVCMATREAIQDMKRRGKWGHIINISSLSGHRVPNGAGGGAFYSATKHALRALTEGLRQEARAHNSPLRVSSISPGVVETEFYQVQTFGKEGALDHYTKFKCLQPEDIAAAVVWVLASPDHMEVNDVLLRPTQQLL